MFRFIFTLILTALFSGLAHSQSALKNGDIIFIVSTSGQGKAIQLATHSKFTHVGIVFIENGKTMIYHAVEPVMKSTLSEFLAFSSDGKYEVRRLKDQSLLTEAQISNMQSLARKDLGKHYDLGFSWDDERLYCSEYVWKLYKRTLNLEIGALRPLRSFDLSHPAVQYKLQERYGKNIPLEEKMISPGDMFDSALLQ